jgi:hypothetical protein
MRRKLIPLFLICSGFLVVGMIELQRSFPKDTGASTYSTNTPKTWDDDAMSSLEVPLANPVGSPKQVSADYYYKIPILS